MHTKIEDQLVTASQCYETHSI